MELTPTWYTQIVYTLVRNNSGGNAYLLANKQFLAGYAFDRDDADLDHAIQTPHIARIPGYISRLDTC